MASSTSSSGAAEGVENTVGDDGRSETKYGRRTYQIGSLIPAVPTFEGDAFWGYTAVPEEGVRWWRTLPLIAQEGEVTSEDQQAGRKARQEKDA